MAAEIDPTLTKVGGAVTGGLVSLKFLPGASWWERVTNGLSGMAAAYFLCGPVASRLKMDDAGSIGALAFLIGCFGVAVMMRIHEYIKIADIGAIFRRK
jgi:hypothetical protein